MILKFIGFLEKQNIDYLILNGYEDLYDDINESDVDILFKKKDFRIIEDIVKSVCEKEGWTLVQLYHQDVWAKNIFLFDVDSLQILNLDIYGFLSRMKVPLFSEKELFQRGRLFKNINVLNSCHEFIYYLAKKLDKNDLSTNKFNVLRKLFLLNSKDCKLVLKDYFPTTYAIIEQSFLNNEIEILNREIIIKDFLKRRKPVFWNYTKNSYRFIKRILRPTGFVIAFLGPDGSGKSTIIELIKESNLPFRQTKYFHLKPIITDNTKPQVINPHVNSQYSPLISYIKLLYFIFQYNFGWLKNILPLKIRSTLVVFDRYYDDLFVDTKRYRYGGKGFMVKLVDKIIPKPDVYFVLTASSKIIYERKKEVSLQELERQIHSYRSLTSSIKYHALDAGKPPKEITSEIIRVIMQKMNKRYSL